MGSALSLLLMPWASLPWENRSRSFPLGLLTQPGDGRAARLPGMQQPSLSSMASRGGFKVIWHPLTNSSCRAQFWGVSKEVANDMWSWGRRQCHALDATDCFYVCCICKAGRATFVLTKRDACSASCSSQVGRTCCQWLCSSTSTCCGSNQ